MAGTSGNATTRYNQPSTDTMDATVCGQSSPLRGFISSANFTNEAAQVDLRNPKKRKQPAFEHEAAQTELRIPTRKQLSNKADAENEARHLRKSSVQAYIHQKESIVPAARPQPNKALQTSLLSCQLSPRARMCPGLRAVLPGRPPSRAPGRRRRPKPPGRSYTGIPS